MGNKVTCASRSAAPHVLAVKHTSFDIKVKNDGLLCGVTGIAITKDKRRLLVDHDNNKVKLFSPDMKFLSSVSLPDMPLLAWDIAVINDVTAVVTSEVMTLILLEISGRQLSIIGTVELDYSVWGIASCKDKLLVTCPRTVPPSVKLIDQTGRVYWSVSTDQQGGQLFREPLYVCCQDVDGVSNVLVTDLWKNTLTRLKAETGEVVTRQLEWNTWPRGITTNSEGNVFVCYYGTGEVSVLTGDLSEERVLLTAQDGMCAYPCAIVYDETRKKLIVGYGRSSNIDCFRFYLF